MARSRNIKPGYFINYELGSLDPLARILFAGLWTIADREGRLEDVPPRIKIQTVPYDDCDVDELLEQLAAGKDPFIIRYSVDGKKYIQITNWDKHQNPHVKESASVIPPYTQLETETEQAPDLYQTSTRQEQEMHQHDPADSLNLIPDSLNLIPYNDILDLYHAKCPSLPKVIKLNSNRKSAIKARLKDHGMEGLITLFEKAEASDFLSGRNGKWTACNLDWLLKDSNCLKVLEGNYTNTAHQHNGKPIVFETFGETAAERLLREEIERERAEADIIDIAWSEGG